jgi:TonB family protein
MDGDHIGDGGGYGGLDGVGTGWGGGGDGRDTIGVGGLNTLGHGGDCREGQDCDRGRRAAVTRMAERRTRFEVTTRPPTVTPGVPPELIRRVVLRNISQVNRCYEQGLSVNPRAAGRVAVRFAITPDGSVLASSVADDTLGMPAVSQCIAGAVRRWSFSLPADSGTVTVTYPFSLMPADQ